MKVALSILFLTISVVTCGQTIQTDCKLILDIMPAFIRNCQISIVDDSNDNLIELTVYTYENGKAKNVNSKSSIDEDDLVNLKEFFESYKYEFKSSTEIIDSGITVIEGDTSKYYTVSSGADGVTVKGTYLQGNGENKFAFWSPRKESKNRQLMDLVFTLLYKSIKDEDAIDYLKSLERYFQ